MPLIVTDAIVLHTADYLESSKLVRLATREAGVQSVVARGARSSRKRFGSAFDLFAEGQAQIQLKPGRELHALQGFDVTIARPALATELARFTAASALAECVLRVVHEEAAPRVYGGVAAALDLLASSEAPDTIHVALGALWRLVSDVGFMPALNECAECHARLAANEEARFSTVAGGALCLDCSRSLPGGRLLPATARTAILGWLGHQSTTLSPAEARAHQRLLREFITQHIPDSRTLRAYTVWESGTW